MKILFVLGKYLPEKNGGIENYSHWLATLLLQNNHQVQAAILQSSDMEAYDYEGVHVIPLKNGYETFRKLLIENHYDICHFQEYSAFGGIEIFWFKEAKRYCKKIFFTFHLPYFTCYKGDFRYLGVDDCSDFSNPDRCVKCIIATRLHYKKSERFSLNNLKIKVLPSLLKNTNKMRALKANIQLRKEILNDLISTCDNIFIYANWFEEILNENGYDAPSIKKIPYIPKSPEHMTLNKNGIVKRNILFVGRIEKQKGLHLLCQAMNIIATKEIQLDVFGNIVDENYFETCRKEFDFNFKGTLPLADLLQLLPRYDFLVLPSAFTEMYSMMVKHAFHQELPVIASSAKGNVDAVKDGKNGFIFDYNDYESLAKVIDRAYSLKKNGWEPSFEMIGSSARDVIEILDYYT